MNIVVSNPDTIGDMILRQPLYAALRDAGHELLLLAQPQVTPFAQLVAPNASHLAIRAEPYSFRAEHAAEAMEELIGQVRAFRPDMLVLAPFLWTPFEEYLASVLSGVPVVAMNGFPFAEQMAGGTRPQSRIAFTEQVSVDRWSHELEKNQRLAQLILKRPIPTVRPRLTSSTKQMAKAREQLAGVGLTADQYVIACIGEGPRTIQRNWTLDKWAAALRHGITKHGYRYLLIGDASEWASLQQIRELMGPLSDATALIPPDEVDSDLLVGATALSQSYIGRDTGPMHLAAALDKPVLAVYWEAHWPRFTPAALVARVLTLDVPCKGCEGFCHFKESHCVKEVPIESVMGAMDELATGAGDCVAKVLPRPAEVGLRMEMQAALMGRERLAQVYELEAERSHLLREVKMLREIATSRDSANSVSMDDDPVQPTFKRPSLI